MNWLLEHSLLILYISIPTIGLLYMLYEYLKRKQEEKREQEIKFLRELSMYVFSDYCEFVKEHDGYSEDKALREFFSKNHNWSRAMMKRDESRKEEELMLKDAKLKVKKSIEELDRERERLRMMREQELLQVGKT